LIIIPELEVHTSVMLTQQNIAEHRKDKRKKILSKALPSF
jgi:hypothetical protein